MNTPAASIYRERALKALQNDYEEDSLAFNGTLDKSGMGSLPKQAWLMIGGATLLFIVAGMWAIWGTIPITATAQGILVPLNSHTLPIRTVNGGQIKKINVRMGDHVHKGDLIAVLENPNAEQQLQDFIEEQKKIRKSIKEKNIRLQAQKITEKSFFKNQTMQLDQMIADRRDRLRKSRGLLQNKKELFKKKMLPLTDVRISESEVSLEKEKITELLIRKEAVLSEKKRKSYEIDESLRENAFLLQNIRNQIHIKEKERVSQSQILSPVDGQIKEIQAQVGEYLAPQQNLFSVVAYDEKRNPEEHLEALIFVPGPIGQHLKIGMKAELQFDSGSSSLVHAFQEKISFRSEYPISRKMADPLLGSPEFLERFFQQGPPFLVKIPMTHRSPDLHPGTMVSAKFIVQEHSLLNWLKK